MASSSSQRSTLIPAEYPLVCGSAGDEATDCGRPGVTYSTQTVRVPSDRRLIMIPSSIPIPLDSIIAAVLFAPLVKSSTLFDAECPSSGAANKAGGVYDTTSLAPADDQGAFVRLNSSPLPAEPQSLAERGRGVVAALLHHACMESQRRLPTVTEESPFPDIHKDDEEDDEAQVDYGYNDDDALAATSEIESDAHTIGASTPQLPHQLLSTAHTSPEASSGTSASVRGTNKRQRDEPETSDVEKPKKPRNSFFYFRREYHKQTNANGGRTKAKSISGLAGKEWNDMTEDQKEPYRQFAAEDTLRYKQEMKAFKDAQKRGKKKVKVEKPGEAGVGYSMLFDAASSRAGGSRRSTPANGGLVLNRLEPVPMLGNVGNSSHNVDILSYMSDMPVEIAVEFEQTPDLFNEPMVFSVNPDGVLMTDMPTQPDFVSIDYGEHAMASEPAGPPLPPLATSVQHHHPSAYIPVSEHQFVHEHQYIPDYDGAYTRHNQRQDHDRDHHQFQHPQLHHFPQEHLHAQMHHHWGHISSLLGNIDTPDVSNPFTGESLLSVFGESAGPPRQPTMPELIHSVHTQTTHIDQAMSLLNAHQLNVLTASNVADPATELNVPTSISNHLTGIHPSIPDIEVVDASNSIVLPAYSVERRR
ncbi:hypothetical protein GGI20_002375 [Coemansia sp. BCRC 34301]|nr:hypothetical protein GGI20_002375 [Coemansia sp. BCRC 34301]